MAKGEIITHITYMHKYAKYTRKPLLFPFSLIVFWWHSVHVWFWRKSQFWFIGSYINSRKWSLLLHWQQWKGTVHVCTVCIYMYMYMYMHVWCTKYLHYCNIFRYFLAKISMHARNCRVKLFCPQHFSTHTDYTTAWPILHCSLLKWKRLSAPLICPMAESQLTEFTCTYGTQVDTKKNGTKKPSGTKTWGEQQRDQNSPL